MIKPVLQQDAFLADVRAARLQKECLHLWWLGQSGYLLQWDGSHLLLDPYLSDSLTRKYAKTKKPHVRMTELVVDPARLDFIDVITSSHHHTDHLDPDTLIAVLSASPSARLVIPEANRTFVADRLGCEHSFPVGLDAGDSWAAAGLRITAVPAAHETLERDGRGLCKFLGYVLAAGPWKIYHSGDTVLYPGLAEELSRHAIDVAILPINGRVSERGVAGNLSASEAAGLARTIGARLAIPCHYEMFEFNTASPDEFVEACLRLGQPYRLLRCGERWSLDERAGG